MGFKILLNLTSDKPYFLQRKGPSINVDRPSLD